MFVDVSEVVVCETICGVYRDGFSVILYCFLKVVLIFVEDCEVIVCTVKFWIKLDASIIMSLCVDVI